MWYGKPRISRNSGRALGRLLRFRPVSVYVLLWKAKWSKENGFGRIPQPSTISGKNNSKVLSQWVFRLKFLIFIIIILAVFNKYSLDDFFPIFIIFQGARDQKDPLWCQLQTCLPPSGKKWGRRPIVYQKHRRMSESRLNTPFFRLNISRNVSLPI